MMKLLAALIFFTRLPFWRLASPNTAAFKRVVDCWPFVGWLTGGAMAGTLALAAQVWPTSIAVILALITRILLTGTLHEDGLADCCDGFGGGLSRERTLAILKDSHIGTYGVIGLLGYFALLYNVLTALPLPIACAALFCGDAWSKNCAAQLINLLPYARKEEEAKAKLIYDRMTPTAFLWACIGGLAPMLCVTSGLLPFFEAASFGPIYLIALPAPLLVLLLIQRYLRRRIQGYTGDCCGATFLLCELSYYLTVLLLYLQL